MLERVAESKAVSDGVILAYVILAKERRTARARQQHDLFEGLDRAIDALLASWPGPCTHKICTLAARPPQARHLILRRNLAACTTDNTSSEQCHRE